METERAKYQRSGKIGLSFVVLPLFGLVSAVAVAAAYGYGSVYNPSMKLAFILPLLGGGAIGGLMALGGIIGKCRNMLFLTIASFSISLACAYLIWTFFSYALLWRSDASSDVVIFDFLLPSNIWNMMQFIVAEGWYTVDANVPVTGPAFWWKWSFEALTIVGIGTVLPPLLLKDKPFCEVSGKWMTFEKGALNLVPVEDESIFEALITGNLERTLESAPARSDAPVRLRFDLWRSGAEDGGGVYQLQLVTTQRDKKGNSEEKEKEITGRFVVTQQELERINQRAQVPPADEAIETEAESKRDHSARDGFDEV